MERNLVSAVKKEGDSELRESSYTTLTEEALKRKTGFTRFAMFILAHSI